MKMKIFITSVLLILLAVSLNGVSGVDYNITDVNYQNFFDNNGNVVSGAIADGDTVYVEGVLNNKNLNINNSITIDGKSTGKLVNGTINLVDSNAKNSLIKGLTIENVNKEGIILNQHVNNTTITNNSIVITGNSDFTGWSLYGIVAYGGTGKNTISENHISGSGNVPYFYGIYITPFDASYAEGDYNPQNYLISGNTIKIDNKGDYSAGISIDTLLNSVVDKNNIDVKSNKFTYGIVVSDSSLYGDVIEPSENIIILNNQIKASGSMVYLIETYMGNDVTIKNNTLFGNGDGVYGIASYYTINGIISNNNITTLGGDISSIGYNPDSVGSGNAVITLLAHSDNITVSNNEIETNSLTVINKTQALNVNEENNSVVYIVDDNSYLNFFDNNGNLLPNSPIRSGDTIKIANLNNRNIVVDRKLNIYGFSKDSKFKNGLIKIVEEGSSSLISGLQIESNSTVIIIDSSNDNIIENNVIDIVNINDGSNGYLSLIGILIQQDSSKNQILNNYISLKGVKNSNSVYFYGVEVTSLDPSTYASGANPKDNIISGNYIVVDSGYYANGIDVSQAINTTISNNKLDIKGNSFVYGIYVEYSSWTGANITNNTQIIGNNIKTEGSMIYIIESYSSINAAVINNTLYGDGDAVYGYAGYSTVGDLIKDNNFFILGVDVNNTPYNYDSIGSGHAGILYKFSSNTTISGNNIFSFYSKGGDYGIQIVNSSENSVNNVVNNILSSDNGKKIQIAAYTTDLPFKTTLTISTTNITQDQKATIKVTLKDQYGNLLSNEKVTLNINKKSYTSTTNSKGIAIFSVSNLVKGNIKATANYGGSEKYINSSATKIQVVKAKPLAKLTYSYKDKKAGKYVTRTFTVKNIGTKAGSIGGILQIPKAYNYVKTISNKALYKYYSSVKSLLLQVNNLATKSSTIISVVLKIK